MRGEQESGEGSAVERPEEEADFLPQDGPVLFDLDGTLVDTVPDLTFAMDRTLEELGMDPVGEENVRRWVGNGVVRLVHRALTRSMDPREDAPEMSRAGRAERLFLDFYRESGHARSRLYPGVLPALRELARRGIPLALVTNKPVDHVGPLLVRVGLQGFFSLVLGGDSLPRKKPDPMPLLHAAEHFCASPGECLMVGDSRNDVLAARRAGMPVVATNYGYNHGVPIEEAEPDRVLAELGELLREGRERAPA